MRVCCKMEHPNVDSTICNRDSALQNLNVNLSEALCNILADRFLDSPKVRLKLEAFYI